ncbi:MAG: hypothetical protein IKW80_09460, partial [Thermoguttaceae bacterium]|nr:hypothetical protein [Thermoguttaceae bacterium]
TSIVFYNRLDLPLLKFSSTGVLDITEYNERFESVAIYHAFEPGWNNPYQGQRLSGFSTAFYKETYEYDSFGRTTKHVPTDEIFASTGKLAVWTYDHTPSGLLTSITDPLGVKRVSEYNEVGLVKTIYLENKGKKCILSSDYRYSPTGKIISSKNNFNQITQFEFDSLGRAWKTFFPNGTTGVLEQNGLNQTESETVYFGGSPIKQQKTEYGLNGKPAKVVNALIYNGVSKDVVTKEYLYDSSARVVAFRESMPDSWTTVLYDGMDNIIAAKSPSGSININVYDKGLVVFNSTSHINEVSNSQVTTGELTYYDARNNPWLKIPLDAEGAAVHDRVTITKYNNVGNIIEQITPGLSRQTSLYNSVGKAIQTVFSPLSRNFGEKDIVTTYKYDEGGNVLQKRTDNHAFAIYGSASSPKPDFVDAPQIHQFIFDELGRTVDEIQPDGLIIRKHYNDSSLVQTIEWISKTGKTLRSLGFSYTKDQLVSSIRNNENGKIVRLLAYDHLGHLYRSTDMSGSQTVIVERTFDSFDCVRKETVAIDGKTFPTKNIEFNHLEGIESLSWNGVDLSNPWWRTLTLKSDASGRIKSLDLDGRHFCKWDYQGTHFVQRTIPDSCMIQKRQFNKLNELESISIHSPQNRYPSIELSYKYGKWGEVQTFVSKLQKSENESSVSTDYNQYDANMNLVGENRDQFIPENTELRREQIFNSGTEVVSGRSRRSQYDQAGNVWASWQGEKLNQPWEISSYPREVGTKFYSAASIIKTAPPTSSELQELASNRCASVASYNNDNTLQAKDYSYDEFGCLSGYDGFYNQTVPVSWKLEYDLFGRLVKMHANLRASMTDSNGKTIELDKIDIAELTFVYDAFNRRILKNSYDYSNNIADSYATLYERNHPCLVLQKVGSSSWLPIEQYLWGADQQELLMAVLSPSKEEGIERDEPQRYYLHQDRVFSVIASTKTVANEPYLASVASYLGFGENSTVATIKSITTSMQETNPQAAIDKRLDGGNNAEWTTTDKHPYIELSLDDVHMLSNLTIYGQNQFPQNFEVYVIPVNQKSPNADNIETWKEAAKGKGW